MWSLAAYTTDKQGNKLNPGISLQEIQDGVKFQFLNNEGEIVTVDTNKQVRYVWGVSNFHGKSEYSMGVESFYLLPNDKNELEIHLVLPLTTLLRANKEYDIRLESGLADIYYFMMLKSLCVPEYIAGIDNNVEGYYDYYVFHDNPNQSNYDEIEKLLWGRVFRGKKPEGSPIDYSKSDEDPELVVVDWQGE